MPFECFFFLTQVNVIKLCLFYFHGCFSFLFFELMLSSCQSVPASKECACLQGALTVAFFFFLLFCSFFFFWLSRLKKTVLFFFVNSELVRKVHLCTCHRLFFPFPFQFT